jgi:UDP-2,4-diacetamido-2,4,6-trideoxy-beta-L-altropyranose hydrolase
VSNLLIRADASTQIGTGHIMRCLALAQGWQEHGGKAVFLSHCENDSLRLRLENEGIDFMHVDSPHPDPTDLQATLSLLSELQAEWLATDGYHFDQAYHQAVRRAGYRLLVIDDLAHLPEYYADILLNQNINAGQLPYVCDPYTKLLLGTHYVLLRPEFLAWRDRQREIPQGARKVLVTMGGSDPDNVTLKVLKSIQHMEADGIEVIVVAGSSNPHAEMLNSLIRNSRVKIHLKRDAANMSDLMAWADVAVSAGGTTCWELAFMGVPTVVLVLAENQCSSAEGLEQAGMAINLGWFDQVSNGKIADALIRLLNDSKQRNRMSTSGRQLVDGNGCSRVMRAILDHCNPSYSGRLTIRPATLLDVVPLWQLANDPTIRMNAFNPGPIIFDQHAEWLKGKLASHDTRIWILEFDGNFAAQVRYDRVDKDTAEIDFAVVQALRRKGLGAKALTLTCRAACTELGVKHLIGFSFDSNLPSARAFVKAGFKLISKGKQVCGHSCSTFQQSCEGA